MITYHESLEQGSPEWLAARCGLLTASTMKLLVTPATLKTAANKDVRMHLYELCAQRVNKYVEPAYVSDDMDRGSFDEIEARQFYNDKISPITEMGFITNDKWGFVLGYSPDGLVGEKGQIEIKSRLQKFQFKTIVNDEIDPEFLIQLQTGLLVSEREFCDFVQYSNGMPYYIHKCHPDAKIQEAILEAVGEFEKQAALTIEQYLLNAAKYLPTERKVYEQEIII